MGNLNIADVFGDNMVLQRDSPIKFWGTCAANAVVTAEIGGREVTVNAKAELWTIVFPPMGAERGLELIITAHTNLGIEKAIIKNICIGEVWIAGGQSNMEFPLRCDADREAALKHADNSDIRFYTVPRITYPGQDREEEIHFRNGKWRVSTQSNALDCSAAGFYFALQINKSLNVPVGIICCNFGGTSASAWQPEKQIEADADLNIYTKEYLHAANNLSIEEYTRKFKGIRKIIGSIEWEKKSDYLLRETISREDQQKIMQNTDPELITPLPGPFYENKPGILYENMLKKIIGYCIKGVLWYQGESDEHHAELYAKLFSSMTQSWREAWGWDMPFLFVQLAPFAYWMGSTGEAFPVLREQQEAVSKTLKHTYMVSIMDSGMENDIHPKHKKPVGDRLALMARGKVYGEDIPCESPEFFKAVKSAGRVEIKFRNARNLFIKGDTAECLDVKSGANRISPLKICTSGNELLIENSRILPGDETEILFAWADYVNVNLYNEAGLPAKPFRVKIK